MLISASISADRSTERTTEELVAQLGDIGVDHLHVDATDPSIFDLIARIRRISAVPIDMHIISGAPESFLDGLHKFDIEAAAFQLESLARPWVPPEGLPGDIGLAITSSTAVEALERYSDHLPFVMFMTTVPGQSGGTFDRATFSRIRRFKEVCSGGRVHVDGGVNGELAPLLRNAGVALAVSGSYLVNGRCMKSALRSLRACHGERGASMTEAPHLHS